MDEYRAAVAAVPAGAPLIIGGKSMGGRVASLVADELYSAGRIAGLACLGYPFHPPKKPEQLRTAHLLALACPALIVQGERDPFGTRAEVEDLPPVAGDPLSLGADGDHDLGPRGASGFTRKGNLAAAADAIANWFRPSGSDTLFDAGWSAKRAGWVERSADPTRVATPAGVGSSLTLDPTYASAGWSHVRTRRVRHRRCLRRTGCARGRRCGSMRTAPRMIAADTASTRNSASKPQFS